MRITHEWKELDRDQPKVEGYYEPTKVVKRTWSNVFDVTFYEHITWKRIYWCTTTTGVRAYCFKYDYGHSEDNMPQSIWFENEHEMRRFQENLRLQEENARASTAA